MITIEEIGDVYRRNDIDFEGQRQVAAQAPNEDVAMLCLAYGIIDLLPTNRVPHYWFNLVRTPSELESEYLFKACSHLISAQAYDIILSHMMKCEEEQSDQWWKLALNRFLVQCEIMRMQTA